MMIKINCTKLMVYVITDTSYYWGEKRPSEEGRER